MTVGPFQCLPACETGPGHANGCPAWAFWWGRHGSDKKPGQYYPTLAEAVRRAYRLTIDVMRDAAQACGYALTEHGSLARDIDLVAVPWTEEAKSADEVAEAIRAAAAGVNNGACFEASADKLPRAKPHGRRAWAFHLGGGPYIDLSVMPRLAVPQVGDGPANPPTTEGPPAASD